MEEYQKNFAEFLAQSGSLFFGQGLVLKDGRPTPYFVNMGVFNTARQIDTLGAFYAAMINANGFVPAESTSNTPKIDVIFGPSYKGSALAIATALGLYVHFKCDLPVEYDRKEAKTHGDASGGEKMFVNGAFFDGARIFMVDDVATSFDTKYEALEKIAAEARKKGWSLPIVGVGVGVDREQTTALYRTPGDKKTVVIGEKGQDAQAEFIEKTGIPVFSIAGIRDITAFLHQNAIPVKVNGSFRPLDDQVMDTFNRYMETYGVKR